MPIFDRLIELPLLRTIYLVFAACLAVMFAVACIVAILNFDWTSTAESPAEYVNGTALGLSALVALVIGHQRPKLAPARLFWYAVAVGLMMDRRSPSASVVVGALCQLSFWRTGKA